MHLNLAGIFQCVVLVFFFPVCGFFGWLLERRGNGVATRVASELFRVSFTAEAKAPSVVSLGDPVAPTPKHLHILEMERSAITITEAGGIHARCVVAGCGEAVYIAPNLAAVDVGTGDLQVKG